YMQDRLNARLMGQAPTGNGRRESYAHPPMPRMTNTFMLAGQDDPREILKAVSRGLYAVNFGGGQVDITSGKFVFSASEAYLIEEQSFSASVRLGQVDTVTHSREQRLALRVFAGRASAAASTSDLSRESLERVVDEATALARVTAEDPHAGLPDAAELIEHVPDLQLEDHEGPEPTPEDKIELARRAEAAALAADPRITNSEGAQYFDRRAHYAYATSHGFARGYSTSSFGLTVSPVAAKDG